MKKTALQEYATRKLKDDVKRLLRDPSKLASPAELRTYYLPLMRKVATQCGINFDVLVREGTPQEQDRLRRIEQGTQRTE